jgi:hypothetical protein
LQEIVEMYLDDTSIKKITFSWKESLNAI